MVGAVERSGIAIRARLLVVRSPAGPCSGRCDATAACSDGRRPERNVRLYRLGFAYPRRWRGKPARGQRADKTQDSGLMT